MIEIIDNLLPKYYLEDLQDSLLNPKQAVWQLKTNLTDVEGVSDLGSYGLNLVLYQVLKDIGNVSVICNGYSGALSKALVCIVGEKIEELINNTVVPLRCRADLTFYNSDVYCHPIHTDMEDWEHISAIFYVDNSDGNTLIYDYDGKTLLKEIEPVKNRLVIFDGLLPHTGHSPSKHNTRLLINMNFLTRDLYDRWSNFI